MNMLLSKKSTVRSSGNDTRITLCRRSVRIPRETLRFSTPLPFPTATLPSPPRAQAPAPNPQIAPALSCRFACCSTSLSYWAEARPHLPGEARASGALTSALQRCAGAPLRETRERGRGGRGGGGAGAAFEIARRAGGGAGEAGEAVGESWVVESLFGNAGEAVVWA